MMFDQCNYSVLPEVHSSYNKIRSLGDDIRFRRETLFWGFVIMKVCCLVSEVVLDLNHMA